MSCGDGEIRPLYESSDSVTFLCRTESFRPFFCDLLSGSERDEAARFKGGGARRRFVVSRAALRHILTQILPGRPPMELARNEYRRIVVRDDPSVWISLSHAGPWVAVTIAKRKVGTDIEEIRPLREGKIASSPLFSSLPLNGEEQVIHGWTLVEACAKLKDENPYPLLNDRELFAALSLTSWCIDRRMIFSLASACGDFSDTLVLLDMSGIRNPRTLHTG